MFFNNINGEYQERLKPIKLDLQGHLDNLYRRRLPDRVFYFENGLEPGIKDGLCNRFDLCDGLNKSDKHYNLKWNIRIQQFLGQEFMRVFPGGITWQGLPTRTTAAPPSIGPIQTWEDFESYPWPQITDVDFSDVEWFERNLPDNIGMWAMAYLFQQVSNLFGFAPMCMILMEDRELIKAVIEKVGLFFEKYVEILCGFTRVAAINVGDDMGHKTDTFIDPDDIRQLFIPWHKRIIDAAHSRGKLGIFHVCGRVDAIIDDLIDTVGIDAKHSTQDVVEPIISEKKRIGNRVALLGGVDIDFITRSDPQQIRKYTRNILEHCQPGGGFSFGVGNWVADSIPLDNYLTMIDEARNFTAKRT